ncbi:hypothetical protein [Streptomyces sp. NPDC001020]
MATRSTAVTAAIAAGAALVATGITYASAASEPANVAPIAQQAAPVPAPAAAPAPESALEGNSRGGSGRGGNSRGDNGRGDNDRDYQGKGNEGHEEEEEEHEHRRRHFIGRIHVNEREIPAIPDGCIVVVSGLGSKSINVTNESKKTVEVFSGATCDNGAPIAVVGPWSQADGLRPRHIKDGVKVKHGVVASVRVIKRHHEGKGGGGDFDRD